MDHYKSNRPDTFIKHSYTHSLQLIIIYNAFRFPCTFWPGSPSKIKINLSNTNLLVYEGIHLKFAIEVTYNSEFDIISSFNKAQEY